MSRDIPRYTFKRIALAAVFRIDSMGQGQSRETRKGAAEVILVETKAEVVRGDWILDTVKRKLIGIS